MKIENWYEYIHIQERKPIRIFLFLFFSSRNDSLSGTTDYRTLVTIPKGLKAVTACLMNLMTQNCLTFKTSQRAASLFFPRMLPLSSVAAI